MASSDRSAKLSHETADGRAHRRPSTTSPRRHDPPRRPLHAPLLEPESAGSFQERMVPDTRERLKAVLQRANRELLRELALQASTDGIGAASGSNGVAVSGGAGAGVGTGTGAGAAPGSLRLEQLMHDVAERVLAEAPLHLLAAASSADGSLQSASEIAASKLRCGRLPPAEPLLGDLKAVHWDIWSGSEELSKTSPAAGVGAVSGSDDCPYGLSEVGRTMERGLVLRPTTQQHTYMRWHERPRTVLLVAKPGDREVTQKLREIAVWLDSQGIVVVLEEALHAEALDEFGLGRPPPTSCSGERTRARANSEQLGRSESPRASRRGDLALDDSQVKVSHAQSSSPRWHWGSPRGLPVDFISRLRTFNKQRDELERSIDLVISLGGDGTLCWVAGLFVTAVPPVIALAGGSLGFLTPFPMTEWMKALVPILGSNQHSLPRPVKLVCRMRFQVRLRRAGHGGGFEQEGSQTLLAQALNEVLVHRGSSSHLVKLEVSVGRTPVTLVQGDGLILATPTGSTAYSLAAGGSMVHPSVPGIILTPVCPHSLSFRPVVLPDSAVVKIMVPSSSRNNQVMVAVDGKDKIELSWGDCIEVAVSRYPLPTICNESETDDWFLSVNEALRWNLRQEQKSLQHF